MSAPHIPNLNTLRRGGERGRGRGRGGETHDVDTESGQAASQVDKDKIIQGTDLDAATSRLSAVECGYLDDPFAQLIFPGGHADRRLPLMNRGTYARTTAIDILVDKFLASPSSPSESSPHDPNTNFQTPRRRQIISLGAGSDTRFFRLKRKQHQNPDPEPDHPLALTYHELDFASNTAAKIQQLRTPAFTTAAREHCNLDLATADASTNADATSWSSPSLSYFIHAVDLRTLPNQPAETAVAAALPGLDLTAPTLLISECCLIYLAPTAASAVLSTFAALPFPALGVIIYEPIRPDDAFGRTMVRNLGARGVVLQTLHRYPDLISQRRRLEELGPGWEARARDLDQVWGGPGFVAEGERKRVEALEWLDELEEWRLLMRHYCVVWGWREDDAGIGDGDGDGGGALAAEEGTRVFREWHAMKGG